MPGSELPILAARYALIASRARLPMAPAILRYAFPQLSLSPNLVTTDDDPREYAEESRSTRNASATPGPAGMSEPATARRRPERSGVCTRRGPYGDPNYHLCWADLYSNLVDSGPATTCWRSLYKPDRATFARGSNSTATRECQARV